jgi:hypothetical protein
VKRFWLEWGEARYGLEPGVLIIGRGSTAHLVVNDALVSRQHARLTIGLNLVTIEDLSSANGVHVNKRRIDGPADLSTGDEIRIGSVEFDLRAEDLRSIDRSSVTPATLPGYRGMVRVHPSITPAEGEHTAQVHIIDTLGTVVDKVLALGRGDEAERILSNALQDVLACASSDRPEGIPRHVYPRAAHYAVRLAAATNRSRWIDYAIQLYATLGLTLPAEVVDQLYIIVRQVPRIRLSAFDSYLDSLRRRSNLNPSERFVVQRLEGLRTLVAVGVRA